VKWTQEEQEPPYDFKKNVKSVMKDNIKIVIQSFFHIHNVQY